MSDRRDRRRERRELDADDPGAPPGFILDDEDDRTGSHVYGDETGCAEIIRPEKWDAEDNPLARGEGE